MGKKSKKKRSAADVRMAETPSAPRSDPMEATEPATEDSRGPISRLEAMAAEGGYGGQVANMFAKMMTAHAAHERGDYAAYEAAQAAYGQAAQSFPGLRDTPGVRAAAGEDMSGTPGYILGRYTDCEKAKKYVELMMAPGGESVLMGEAGMWTGTIGEHNLMWCDASALEVIAAVSGLYKLVHDGASRHVAASMVMRPESFGTVCMFLAYTPQICHEDEEHEDGFEQVDMKDPEGDPWYGEDKPDLSPGQGHLAYVKVMERALGLIRAVVAHAELGAAALAALRASSHFDAFVSRLIELSEPHTPRSKNGRWPVQFPRSPLPQVALELLLVVCGGRQADVSDGLSRTKYSMIDDPWKPTSGTAIGMDVFALVLERAAALGVRGDEHASDVMVMSFAAVGSHVSKEMVAKLPFASAHRVITDLAPKVAAAEAKAAAASLAACKHFLGKFVTIKGLVGRPELNTRRGLLTGFNAEKGRYQVSLEALPVPGLEFDGALLIKPDNLDVEMMHIGTGETLRPANRSPTDQHF